MQTEELITRVSQIIQREDGSEVRIVAQNFAMPGMAPSVGINVHYRERITDDWKLCSDRPHPDWRNMELAEYDKHGRSEMLKMAHPGIILKLASAIGKPMSYLG